MSVAKYVRMCAGVLSLALVAGPAMSADVYNGGGYQNGGNYQQGPVYVPVPLWQGFYFGGHLGGAWSSVNPAENVLLVDGGGSIPISGFSSSGFFGGVQAGYNFQFSNLLYGIEGDLGGIDNTSGAVFPDPKVPARVLNATSSGGAYGDITGRGGFIIGNALIYVKGGFAFFSSNVTINDAYDNINQSSGSFTGWTLGGGAEWLLNPNWTVKVEYQYFDLGNNNFNCCSGGSRLDNSITSSTVKVGFNYLFHNLRSPFY